jgi:AAHS family 4-hydroxybenzoate transporter-like MFS transporter
MMTISFTAPYLRDQFHLDQVMVSHIFSSGVAGMLLGGFVFTWLGDWIGRRPTLLMAGFSFGVLTILTGFAHSYEAFLALRFLDGLAIGGLLPLAWALNIEFVPTRMRSSVVTVIMIGYSVGLVLGGPVTVMLAPHYGWPAVYFAGGAASLAAATLLVFGLPESVRFLISRSRSPAQIAALLNRTVPEAAVSSEDRFILSAEPIASEPFKPRQLFQGRLALITPLLWIGYIASSLAIYSIAYWTPSIFEQMHFTRSVAAYVASLGSALAAAAGLALMRFTDGKGPAAVAAFPALAVPVLLVVGLAGPSGGTLIALTLLSTLLVGGGHYGVHSIASIYYPSAIRASGGGWATSISKLGGIAGPTLCGYLLASGIPAIRTFAFLACCPAVLALCALGIAFATRRRPVELTPSLVQLASPGAEGP